jgi:hypothetical protein
MRAYKLFRLRKDGTLGPLFIGARQRIPLQVWLEAEDIPTKGYAHRPGWHCGAAPIAPHLKEKDSRVWCEVEIRDFYPFPRPQHQGSTWLISKWMKVNKILSRDGVRAARLTLTQED